MRVLVVEDDPDLAEVLRQGLVEEEYAVDLNGAWKQALGKMEKSQERRCSGDVPGDTHRFLRVRNRFSEVRWKHVLLPMWSLTFEWKGERYPVLVHGQTGRVVGRAPWSWVKITLLALLLAAAIAAAFVLMSAA